MYKESVSMSERRVLKVFGAALRQARIEKGLTQEELGFESSVHRNYISGVERGVRNPSLIAITNLANGLGTTASALLISAERQGKSRR